MKWPLRSILVVCVVAAGIAFYASTRPHPAKMPGPSGDTQTSVALSGSAYTEHAQYYDIAANYPTTTPLMGTANDAAITQMKNFIGNTIGEFKSQGDFANLTQTQATFIGLAPDRKETLEIKYLISSSSHTVSYIFTTYEDTLGAHGNTFFRTFTFNTTTGALLSLNGLFLANASYLDTLSSISRAKLPGVIGQTFDPSFIQNGTGPDETNFSNFFFDNNDFVILFAPYQVAPYAAGPQTLRIPVADLATILKSEYP